MIRKTVCNGTDRSEDLFFSFQFFFLYFVSKLIGVGTPYELILKAPITITADGNLEYFFHCFSEKIRF